MHMKQRIRQKLTYGETADLGIYKPNICKDEKRPQKEVIDVFAIPLILQPPIESNIKLGGGTCLI